MTITIAVAGKGGTGKTTLAGLLIRRLAEAQAGPILAIDADPASNLNTVLDLLYLNSDLAVNGTWEETKTINVSGTPLNVKFTYTIAEKGIVYTVGSKLYQKVTRVKVVLSAPGVPITTQDINFYYAENIGRIYSKVVLVVPLAGINSSTETKLTAYSIAP